MKKLQELIFKECSNMCGEFSVIVYEPVNNDGIFIHVDCVFPAASLIKLPILLTLFQQNKNLEKRYRLEKIKKVGGCGILKDLDCEMELTLKDLATLMIVISDNVATNILIDMLGMDNINQQIKEIGLKHTKLNRYMMDEGAKEKGIDNYTSAYDVMKVLMEIKKNNMSNIMMDILFRQHCNNKLPFFINDPVLFAHKTGELAGVEHDAGILFMRGKEILLVVLTKNLHHNQHGIFLCQKIGRLVYDFFNKLEK